MSLSQKGMEALKQLKTVFFGGDPLSPQVGDSVLKEVFIQNVIGSSEAGYIPSLALLNNTDWEYFEWNPKFGVLMQPVGHGLYELVIPRQENLDFHPVFHLFADIEEYRTKDVFLPHPTKTGLCGTKGAMMISSFSATERTLTLFQWTNLLKGILWSPEPWWSVKEGSRLPCLLSHLTVPGIKTTAGCLLLKYGLLRIDCLAN
jgi:hypothetical protein